MGKRVAPSFVLAVAVIESVWKMVGSLVGEAGNRAEGRGTGGIAEEKGSQSGLISGGGALRGAETDKGLRVTMAVSKRSDFWRAETRSADLLGRCLVLDIRGRVICAALAVASARMRSW